MLRLALLFLAATLFAENCIYGFGFEIHVAATKIAEKHLTEKARGAVKDLLAASAAERKSAYETTSESHRRLTKKLGTIGSDFAAASLWADYHRTKHSETATFHYVNVPLGSPRYDARFDPSGVHLVAKLNEFIGVLKESSAPKSERAIALLWVIHLAEDLHMPLHVATNNDRGGNLTKVTFVGRALDMHALWDYGLMESSASGLSACSKALSAYDTAENRRKWMSGTVEQWADESVVLAAACYKLSGSERLIASGDTLGRDYAEQHFPVLCERSAQAGIRLAFILNSVFP